MEVLVVDGHGKVGLRLLRLLARDGHRGRGVIRNPDQAGDLEAAGAEAVLCDLERGDDLRLGTADAIVSGAGPGSGPARKRTVDYGAAVKSMEAASALGVTRFVIVSSIGTHDVAGAAEEMRPYLQAKRDADDALKQSGLSSRTASTTLTVSQSFGARITTSDRLCDWTLPRGRGVPSDMRGRSKPERHRCWLHGLMHHSEQLIGQAVEVDLLAESGAERLDRLGGVVLASVKAPVDRLLDAATQWLEQRRHGQGGAGDGRARPVATEELSYHNDAGGIAQTEDGGERRVDQGAVDEPVDVVQAIPEDRDAGGDRHGDYGQEEQAADGLFKGIDRPGREPSHLGQQVQRDRGDERKHQQGARVGQPLELLTLIAP
jgi:hypothetical protein